MKVNYEARFPDGHKKSEVLDLEVKDIYSETSAKMSTEDFDRGVVKVVISTDDGEAKYTIKLRGGTRCITEVENTFPMNYLTATLTKRYLTCIDEDKNAYKFYKLEPLTKHESEIAWDTMESSKKQYLKDANVTRGDVLIKASWGRMGVNKGELWGEKSCYYTPSMYWVKYQEKLGKGYVDRSDTFFADDNEVIQNGNNDKKASAKKRIAKKDGPSFNLFQKLRSFAKRAVENAKVKVPISKTIIAKSKEFLDAMRNATTVEEFNKQLLELMATLQRPISTGDGCGVKRMLATDKNDFARIIEREDDLIQAMEGSVDGTISVSTGDFDDYGIEVYEANDKQKAEVMRHLSDKLKGKVKNVYRVVPKAQKKIFNDYLKSHKIEVVKMLWHGSRNENWMSIIQNSLQLNPNAIITGKMFGHGIYFAPSSLKSWNYTSYQGTSWAGGTSDTAFMGLYAVAYGVPYDVYAWSSGAQYEYETEARGCNCLHAHAGVSLKNDEIVFYTEKAVLLNYIVEFN